MSCHAANYSLTFLGSIRRRFFLLAHLHITHISTRALCTTLCHPQTTLAQPTYSHLIAREHSRLI